MPSRFANAINDLVQLRPVNADCVEIVGRRALRPLLRWWGARPLRRAHELISQDELMPFVVTGAASTARACWRPSCSAARACRASPCARPGGPQPALGGRGRHHRPHLQDERRRAGRSLEVAARGAGAAGHREEGRRERAGGDERARPAATCTAAQAIAALRLSSTPTPTRSAPGCSSSTAPRRWTPSAARRSSRCAGRAGPRADGRLHHAAVE